MRYYPTSNEFAAISILGLVCSAIVIYYNTISLTWGVTFFIFFSILFIVSIITLKPTVYEKY